jgi:hypothetical protein
MANPLFQDRYPAAAIVAALVWLAGPGPHAGASPGGALGREFTVFAGSTGPRPVADAVAREFSVLVREQADFAVADAVAREFVVHVPAAPVITLASGALPYTEGDGWVAIDPLAGVYDPDTDDFGGGELRVELVGGGSAGDALGFGESGAGAGEITLEDGGRVFYRGVETATFTGGGGSPVVLVFHPGTGLGAVAAMVRHVRFGNAQRYPAAGARIAAFRLSDGESVAGPAATREIVVVPLNQPPLAGADFVGVEMDVPLAIPAAWLLANDSDPDGDPLSLSLIDTTTSAGGVLAWDDGGLIYTPPPGFAVTDRFDYRLADPYGGEGTGRVTLFVRAADDPSCSVLDAAFGRDGGGFSIHATGLPGRTYNLLASEDLAVWNPVAAALADGFGAIRVADPAAVDHPRRFYTFGFAAAPGGD